MRWHVFYVIAALMAGGCIMSEEENPTRTSNELNIVTIESLVGD